MRSRRRPRVDVRRPPPEWRPMDTRPPRSYGASGFRHTRSRIFPPSVGPLGLAMQRALRIQTRPQSRPYGTLIVPASTGPPLNGSAGDQSTSNRSARSQGNGTARITQLPSAPYLFSRARVPLRCPAMSRRLQSSTCNVLDSPTKRKGRQHVRPALTSQSFLANLGCCTHGECTAYCTTHGATA